MVPIPSKEGETSELGIKKGLGRPNSVGVSVAKIILETPPTMMAYRAAFELAYFSEKAKTKGISRAANVISKAIDNSTPGEGRSIAKIMALHAMGIREILKKYRAVFSISSLSEVASGRILIRFLVKILPILSKAPSIVDKAAFITAVIKRADTKEGKNP